MTEFDDYKDSEFQTNSLLILCIEEQDSLIDKTSIDNRLFIGWNNLTDEYFIRGRRQDTSISNYVPYAFQSKNTNDVYDFIEFIVGIKGKKNITLYNYNNIINFDEVTYEFLEYYLDKDYEIAGYDNVKLNSQEIKRQLRLLKNIYNWIN
jgi:hypothetical protein